MAARSGASGEVVREGVDGLLYEPDDAKSLVGVARRMFEEPGLRERLSEGARESAENRSWSASTETVRGYYAEALAAKRVGVGKAAKAVGG